jgi:hypothetical protein
MRPALELILTVPPWQYFGWGQEDDDMFERIRTVFKKVKHIDQKVGKYHALTHGRVKDLDVTVNFDANAKRLKEMRKAGTRQLQLDGFNTADEYHKVIATLHGPFTETRREDRWSDMTIIVGTDYEHLLVDVLKVVPIRCILFPLLMLRQRS